MERQSDVSRSASRVDRKHKIQTVLGGAERTNEAMAEDDFSPDGKGDILDLRPSAQQGKWWNLGDRKDQREILWQIRKKRPKLVIGYGKCILVCTVFVP